MPNIADVVADEAFGVTALTESFMSVDHVPGRAGQLVFSGAGEGIDVDTATFETMDESISLIPTAVRGAPGAQEGRDKRKLRSLPVPHIPLDDRINAAEVRNVRRMGQQEAVETIQAKLNQQLSKMSRRHDMTIENLRMGALLGKVYDADGDELYDLFSTFGVSAESAVNFALDTAGTNLRGKCQEVTRAMRTNAKTVIPSTAMIHAFCGDTFFDKMLAHPKFEKAYEGYERAARMLGSNFAYSAIEFGGIIWENYRGTDGGGTTAAGTGVGVAATEARFFWTGVPGMYAEYYAPGDFVDTVGAIGLPRYASVALDPLHGRFIDVHTEQNPLPVCLRPKTLMSATAT